MKRIKLLDNNVINQIAAGEVIEKPASVVKEIVENSLDAGATKIEVEIAKGGRYLRISDNGSGIHPEDINLAFSRHATSKITAEKDLWNLNTLGFRGEALASIFSVSKITCLTKVKNLENGIKASNQNDKLVINPIGCAVGTTIEVDDLFYNVPARLKFLKRDTTEISSILETIQNLAISHPEVAIVCKNQNKTILKTSGSNDLAICLSEIYSKDILPHLLNINALDEEENYFITGLLTEPSYTRSNKKAIYTIINGRFVKCHIIIKAIESALNSFIADGKYPIAVINLLIPSDKLDVNVHPSKKEVKYASTNQIYQFIHYSIRKTLEDADFYLKNSFDNIEKKSIDNDLPKNETTTKEIINNDLICEKTNKFGNKSENNTINTHISENIIEKSIELYTPLNKEIKINTSKPSLSTQLPIVNQLLENNLIEKKSWKVIGQVFNTYIVLETDEGLQLVDQHIASERAIYDKLKRKPSEIAGQRLLIIEKVDITLDQISLLEEYTKQLKQWGFEFELDEDNKLIIKQVPQLLTGKKPSEIFEEVISILEKFASFETLEDNILKTIACHAAIRAGDILTFKQMEDVIYQWKHSDYPYTCPHGRKIAHNIDNKELSGYFDRQ